MHPRVEIEVAPLYELQTAFFQYCALRAALRSGLFGRLAGPKTAEEAAGLIGAEPELTEKLLDALAAAGYLDKEAGRFRNSALTTACLVEGSDLYQGEYWLLNDEMLAQGFLELAERVAPGPAAPDRDARVRRAGLVVQAGPVQQMVGLIKSLPGLDRARRLLDLGGGLGLFGLALAAALPGLKVTLFDLPQVIDSAREVIRGRGLAEAFELQAGDMTRDPLGQGFDLVLASDCLYACRPHLETIFRKVRRALNEGGTFICRHLELDADGAGPAETALLMLGYELAGLNDPAGFSRAGEIPRALRAAGFTEIETRSLRALSYPYRVHIARK